MLHGQQRDAVVKPSVGGMAFVGLDASLALSMFCDQFLDGLATSLEIVKFGLEGVRGVVGRWRCGHICSLTHVHTYLRDRKSVV